MATFQTRATWRMRFEYKISLRKLTTLSPCVLRQLWQTRLVLRVQVPWYWRTFKFAVAALKTEVQRLVLPHSASVARLGLSGCAWPARRCTWRGRRRELSCATYSMSIATPLVSKWEAYYVNPYSSKRHLFLCQISEYSTSPCFKRISLCRGVEPRFRAAIT